MTSSSEVAGYGLRGFGNIDAGAGSARRPKRGSVMAYILRSLAVIGVIALNSPVQSEKQTDHEPIATAQRLIKAASQIDADGAAQSLSAARETAQILAGLDPETRQRLLAMAMPAIAAKSETTARSGAARTR